jgi:hypothetical protein
MGNRVSSLAGKAQGSRDALGFRHPQGVAGERRDPGEPDRLRAQALAAGIAKSAAEGQRFEFCAEVPTGGAATLTLSSTPPYRLVKYPGAEATNDLALQLPGSASSW